MDGGRRLLRSLKEALSSPFPQRAAFAGADSTRSDWSPESLLPTRTRRRSRGDIAGHILSLGARRGAGLVMTICLFGAGFLYGAFKG